MSLIFPARLTVLFWLRLKPADPFQFLALNKETKYRFLLVMVLAPLESDGVQREKTLSARVLMD